MKDQNGKPENGENARVLKIAEVGPTNDRREPQNPFPGKQVLCAGAEEVRVRVESINPNRSATVSILDSSGEEIDRADIAEGETRSVAGRVITLISVGLLAGAACEYNYTYDYGDQDAATNPDGPSCSEVQTSDRCNDTIAPNSKRCMVYEGAAIDLDGYFFRVGEVRSEGGNQIVPVDILATSLSCQPVGSMLELVVGAADETIFLIGPFEYRARATSLFRESTEFPALVDLSVYRVSTEPAPSVCADETDRCFYRDETGVRCVAYEDRGVQFDNYLFVVTGVREGRIIDLVIQDKELGCETIATLSVEAGGEERLYAPGTGSTYGIKARNATPGSAGIPATADLEVRRVSDEPAPTVCPETTDRCETVYGAPTAISCPIYEGLAAEINGVLVKIARIWEEGGVRKARVELYDRELGCADTSGVLELSEGENGEVGVGSKVFTIDVRGITLVGYGTSWASVIITDTTAAASCATISPDSCTTSRDSVRCEMPAGLVGLKLGTVVFTPYLGCDGGTVSIYDDTIPGLCVPVGNVSFSAVPGTMEYRYGAYYYKVTVFGCSSDSARVDMQVERRALLCDGSEVSGIINVGEMVDSGVTGLKVRLDDISREGEAILTILDRNWNDYTQITLAEGEARLIDYDGTPVVVSINDVAAGVLLISKWVDITVQTCE